MCTSEISDPNDAVSLFGAISPLKQGQTTSDQVLFTRPATCDADQYNVVVFDVAYMHVNSVIVSALES